MEIKIAGVLEGNIRNSIQRVGRMKSSMIRNLLFVGQQVLMFCELKKGNVELRK